MLRRTSGRGAPATPPPADSLPTLTICPDWEVRSALTVRSASSVVPALVDRFVPPLVGDALVVFPFLAIVHFALLFKRKLAWH